MSSHGGVLSKRTIGFDAVLLLEPKYNETKVVPNVLWHVVTLVGEVDAVLSLLVRGRLQKGGGTYVSHYATLDEDLNQNVQGSKTLLQAGFGALRWLHIKVL